MGQIAMMLVFLSLLTAVMAAPQVYPYYGNYGMYHGYPGYGYPMVHTGYPVAAYPAQRLAPTYPVAATRNLVKFGNFLEINRMFEQVATATATVPMTTVKGNFNIQQNGILDFLSGNEAKLSMYIMSSNDLTGKNVKAWIGTGSDCVAALAAGPTEILSVNAPPSINGFYINGATTGFNIDGMNGKMSLKGADKWLLLTESGANLIGCSMMALQ